MDFENPNFLGRMIDPIHEMETGYRQVFDEMPGIVLRPPIAHAGGVNGECVRQIQNFPLA